MSAIQDLTEAWRDHSGLEVETFIKSQIQSTIASLLGKFGDVQFDTETMTLSFYDRQGGTPLGSVTLGGDVYTIDVGADVDQVFYVLANETSKNVTITPSTTVAPFGSPNTTPYPEAYSYTVAVNTGSGYVARITGNIPVSGSATFDIRPFLATGDNYIRISVTGEGSHQTRTMVFTCTLTSLALTCNHTWQDVWMQGQEYVINGIRFTGSLVKTLHVSIDGVEYATVEYAASESYSSTATTFTFPADAFTFSGSGVHAISLWMTASGVSTPVISFNIMCAATGDTTPLVAINAITPLAVNYTSERLFSYAIYNADHVTFEIAATLNSVVYPVASGISISNIEAGFQYEFAYALEVDTGANETKTGTIAFAAVAYMETTQGVAATASTVFDNTYSYLATTGALFYLNAATRSNGTADYLQIVNEMGAQGNFAASYEADWSGFSFSADAWATDPSGYKALVVPAGSSIDVERFFPLAYLSGYNQGMTIEMMLQSANPSDYDTPVLTLADNGLGIYVYPTKISVFGSNENNETAQTVVLAENRMTHLTITFVKDYGGVASRNLVSIYVNGISNINFSFTGSSDFGSGYLQIGQQDTDFYLYKMRVYGTALESTAVFNNFLNCVVDGVEFVRRQEMAKNNLLDNNTVDYALCKAAGYNIMVITMDDDSHPIPSVNNQVSYSGCAMRFEYAADPRLNVSVENIDLDGQGTTSMKYYRWNLRAKTNSDTVWVYGDGTRISGSKVGRMINDTSYIEVDRITAKKNYASSPQGHKMGMTGLYNDLFHEIGLGANLPNSNYRVAVYQFPFVGFVYHSSNNTYEFIGLYTAGPDKGSKVTFGYDKSLYPNCLSIEGPNHNPLGTRFLTPWIDVTYSPADETLMFGGEEGWDCDYVKWETGNKGTQSDWDNILNLYTSEFKPAYNVVFDNSPYIVSHTELINALANPNIQTLADLLTVANAPTIQAGTTNGIKNSLLSFYDNTAGANRYEVYCYRRTTGRYEKLASVDSTLEHNVRDALYAGGYISTNTPTTAQIIDGRAARFKATMGNYWDRQQTLFHYCFCIFYGVTDNFAKNSYPFKFRKYNGENLATGESAEVRKWGWRQDDLDTILSTDNNGRNTKSYSIEHGDLNLSGNQIFQGGDSALWVLIRDNYATELREMMQLITQAAERLASAKNISGTELHSTFFNLTSYYLWEQSAKYFSATLYEQDRVWSYLTPWLINPDAEYNNVHPLDQANGDQYQAERTWMERRIAYIFSKFRLGAFTGTNTGYNGISTTLARQFEFEIIPAIDLYPSAAVASTDYPIVQPAMTPAGSVALIAMPPGGETNNYIHGVDWLTSLGDLSGMVLTDRGGDTNISFAVRGARLQDLKVGDENPNNVDFNATSLTIESPTITSIDARNTTTVSNEVNLLNCPRLRTAYFEGSNATGLLLPVGARLQEVSFPAGARTVFMHSLPFLTEENLSLPALSGITTLYVNNCKHISAVKVLDDIMATGSASLQYATLIWRGELEVTQSQAESLVALAGKTGYVDYVDGNIVNRAGTPYVEGTITPETMISVQAKDALESAGFDALTVNATNSQLYIVFEDSVTEAICLANWDSNSSGMITLNEVANVTSLPLTTGAATSFRASAIQYFNEFKYFTRITSTGTANSGSTAYGPFTSCTSLKEITLPDAMVTISGGSFKGCAALTTVSGGAIRSVNEYAFQNCSNISSIDLSRVTTIGQYAFNGALKNYVLNLPNLTSLGQISFRQSGIVRIDNLGSITSIPSDSGGSNGGCFNRCTSLTQVILPNTAALIGSYAFANTTSLTSVTFPNRQITIERAAFEYSGITTLTAKISTWTSYNQFSQCSSLTTVDLSESTFTSLCDSSGSLAQGAFYQCTKLESVALPTTCTIIGMGCFNGCTKLATVTGTGNVQTIRQYAFTGTKVTSMNLDSVTTIAYRSFNNSSLAELVVPSLQTIGGDSTSTNGAFYNTPLTRVDIGSSCTSIGDRAFHGCTRLVTFIVRATTPPSLGGNTFASTNSTFKIYVPYSADHSILNAYKAATNWSSRASYIFEINPNGTIGNDFTYNYGDVTSGYYIISANGQTEDANYSISPYIAVTPGHSITFSAGIVNTSARLNSYDSDKSYNDYWSCNATPRTITLTANSHYLKLSIYNSAMATGDAYVFDNTTSELLYPTIIQNDNS